MAEKYEQHTIEYFFKKYKIKDSDKKAALLSTLSDIIYDRNMHVVRLEKESDDYKKKQIIAGVEELESKIERIFGEK